MAARRPPLPSLYRITRSGVVWARRWNWDGDRIIHDAVVPSSRPVVGRRSGGYDIDPREFLVTERNAVMRSTLQNHVRAFVEKTPGASWELFTSRAAGSFDHRADMLAAYVSEKIAYRYSGAYDPWQFPDETLSVREGDCEDRALLIASLLLASGISSFNVRVALGDLHLYGNKGWSRSFGHCWVMYKNEAGQWLVIEPAQTRTRLSQRAPKGLPAVTHAEYEPRYLFNDVHLWGVGDAGKPEALRANLKKDWSRVNPTFVGIVHKSILNDALLGVGCPQWVLDKLNRNFTSWLGKPDLTTDAIDLNLAAYDPRDHFDNAYIDDAWQRAQANLDAFKANPTAQLDAFFHAAHAIADFYAHSSYAHFADTPGAASIPLYAPANPAPGRPPDYGPGGDFDLASGRYTTNSTIWNGTAAQAAGLWKGKIVSGRYAQPGDSHSVSEFLCVIPRELRRRPDFAPRGSLPHHNEIAVDDRKRNAKHVLYTTAAAYQRQFGLRYDAAKRHIAQVFKERWKA